MTETDAAQREPASALSEAADELVTLLTRALDQAKQAKEIARSLDQDHHLDRETRKKLEWLLDGVWSDSSDAMGAVTSAAAALNLQTRGR